MTQTWHMPRHLSTDKNVENILEATYKASEVPHFNLLSDTWCANWWCSELCEVVSCVWMSAELWTAVACVALQFHASELYSKVGINTLIGFDNIDKCIFNWLLLTNTCVQLATINTWDQMKVLPCQCYCVCVRWPRCWSTLCSCWSYFTTLWLWSPAISPQLPCQPVVSTHRSCSSWCMTQSEGSRSGHNMYV